MPRLDELAIHLVGGLGSQLTSQSPSDQDIVWDDQPPSDSDIQWDETAPQGSLQQLMLLGSGIADPLKVRERLPNLPAPEMMLGTAGMVIGAETGPFAPIAATVLAGLGGAAGRGIELVKEAQETGIPGELPPSASSDILKSGVFNALLGIAPTAIRGVGKFSINALKARKGLEMFSKLADESKFIQRIRAFFHTIPDRAGGRFKDEFVDELVKTNPKKIGDFNRSISVIRKMLRENPVFRSEQLSRLRVASSKTVEVLRRVFPELLDVEGGEGLVSGGARGLRISGEELSQLEQRAAQLEADVGRPLGAGGVQTFGAGESPTQLTLEDSQYIKKFFTRQFLKHVGKEPVEIPEFVKEAKIAHHLVRADQIGQFEGFEKASSRYHRELLDHRLLKRATGGLSEEGIPKALRTNFSGEPTFAGGGIGRAPEIREAAQRVFLDDPQLAQHVDFYQHAAQYAEYITKLKWRAALFGPLAIGLYGPYSAARRAVARSVFGQGTRR